MGPNSWSSSPARCDFTPSVTAQSRRDRWSARMLGKMSLVTRLRHCSSERPQSREPREAASVTVREVTELVSRNLITREVAAEEGRGCLGEGGG